MEKNSNGMKMIYNQNNNNMKHLFVLLGVLLSTLANSQFKNEPPISKFENIIDKKIGIETFKYKDEFIPKKEGSLAEIVKLPNNTEYSEFRIISKSRSINKDNLGEVVRIEYQDVITGYVYKTKNTFFTRQLLVNLLKDFEVGDIIRIPANRTEVYGVEAFDIDLTRIIKNNKE